MLGPAAAPEFLEDQIEFFRGYARPDVADLHRGAAFGCRDPDDNVSGIATVLQRVVDEVVEQVTQHPAISVHEQDAASRLHHNRAADCLALHPETVDRFAYQLTHIDGLESALIGLITKLGVTQDVIDQ